MAISVACSKTMENGWRPVPWERHKTRFAPYYLSKPDEEKQHRGCILRKGQLLMERPLGMNLEAKEQMDREANQ